MYPNKIIRQVFIVSTKTPISEIKKGIKDTKQRAWDLADKLGYSKDRQEYEIYDTYFPGDSGFYERPLKEVAPQNLMEALANASGYGRSMKYTYVIDDGVDKRGFLKR